MKNYAIEEKYRYFSESVSKGTQKKYFKNNYFYKLDKVGREGFVEYLVSEILAFSNLPRDSFVSYEHCKINNSNGCRSYSFLGRGEEFISMNKLYTNLTGDTDLGIRLQTLSNANERLNYILDIIDSYEIDRDVFRRYLNVVVQLDLLIINTDRHVHNYGVIYSQEEDTFRPAPIFDNGRSLDTDRTGDFSSRTLSGSFTEQVTVFGFPVKPIIQFDYNAVFNVINDYESNFGKCHEINVLINQLNKFSYLFKGTSSMDMF